MFREYGFGESDNLSIPFLPVLLAFLTSEKVMVSDVSLMKSMLRQSTCDASRYLCVWVVTGCWLEQRWQR